MAGNICNTLHPFYPSCIPKQLPKLPPIPPPLPPGPTGKFCREDAECEAGWRCGNQILRVGAGGWCVPIVKPRWIPEPSIGCPRSQPKTLSKCMLPYRHGCNYGKYECCGKVYDTVRMECLMGKWQQIMLEPPCAFLPCDKMN